MFTDSKMMQYNPRASVSNQVIGFSLSYRTFQFFGNPGAFSTFPSRLVARIATVAQPKLMRVSGVKPLRRARF
jgi:hypothetical protein